MFTRISKHILIVCITIAFGIFYFNYANNLFITFREGRENYSPSGFFIFTIILAIAFAIFRVLSSKPWRAELLIKTIVFYLLLTPVVAGPEGSMMPAILGGYIPVCIIITYDVDKNIQLYGLIFSLFTSYGVSSIRALFHNQPTDNENNKPNKGIPTYL